MIYLLGVHHRLQFNGKLKETKELVDFITEKIAQYEITLIAEECSEFSLKVHNCQHSSIQRRAQSLHTKHILIDPTPEERLKRGIISRKYIREQNFQNKEVITFEEYRSSYKQVTDSFALREEFWLEKIQEDLEKNILCICGWDHLRTFPKVLKRHGIEPMIFERIFG